MTTNRQMRPFGVFAALTYAMRAGVCHYRFARRHHATDAISSLVVCTGPPSRDRMDTAGSRWSDWSRMQGAQPIDPQVIWDDIAVLWNAYHTANRQKAQA